ncbi:MAG: N-acetylneuraminate synthase family protein [Nitrospinae bacterium]|nr:N-acetylneuraminate synthase family protein [Nitrospinota bacterium]
MQRNKSFLGNKTILVAEVGINHGGDVKLAEEMIFQAHEAGADYVKLQSFVTEKLLHPSVPYFKQMKKVELSFEDQQTLFDMAKKEGIQLFSTAFDESSVEFLNKNEVPAYKIASMDSNNPWFVKKVAEKNKPLFIATGLSTLDEIQHLLDAILPINQQIYLMHCVSDYPAHPEDMNLLMMQTLEEDFCLPSGLSDHTLGIEIAKIAITMGAKIIEKHFTLDKKLAEKHAFSDHAISMNVEELIELRTFADDISVIIGDGVKKLSDTEKENIKNIRRGLYCNTTIKEGEMFSEENLVGLRPEKNLSVSNAQKLMGSKAKKAYNVGDAIEMASEK